MKVLLLGAGGMLGTDLAGTAPAGVQLVPLRSSDLDITEADALERALDEHQPSVVVNAAAYTAVDRAEVEPEAALAVNGTAVGSLGRLCARREIAVVHFGSDYIFPGNATTPYVEDASVGPVNAYGRSKLAGEVALRESGARALVIRTQWLFGDHGHCFPRTMRERAMAQLPTRVVNDQFGSPTHTADLAAATWALVSRGATGTYHVVGAGVCSWFDMAAVIFAAYDASSLLAPTSTADYPTAARRPSFSALDATRVRREHGIALRSWRVALGEFVASGPAFTPGRR